MKKHLQFLILIIPFLLSCKAEQSVEPAIYIDEYPWEAANPRDLGLNDSLINAGFAQAADLGFINGIVIIKNGKIGATKYFNGNTPTSINEVRSVTKSYLSAFVGIAIQKGIINLDTKLTDYFPAIKASVQDRRVNDITVRHLLTMTSGLKSDYFIFPDNSISNWTDYILSFPLDHDPGTTYSYSDAGAYLLSALLTKAAGQSTYSFAKINFFNQLNYLVQGWYSSPEGITIGGSTMMFTTKNMAVLGLLYLNKGRLNGIQIVPEEWVDASLTAYIKFLDDGSALKNWGYGYFWWLGEMNGHKCFSAIGYGGQFVFCIPDYNMIIAINSDANVSSASADENSTKILNLISKYFITAVK